MAISVWKRWMLSAWLLSLWWGWLSLDAANCPHVLYVSVAEAVLKSSVDIFSQVFVSQLMYLCLLPSSLRCWNDFFLSRLETFSRLWVWTGYFRAPRPDVFLTQCFCSPRHFSAWWSWTAWVSSTLLGIVLDRPSWSRWVDLKIQRG